MAADAAGRLRSLRYLRRGVVRAAGTEIRRPHRARHVQHHRRPAGQRLGLLGTNGTYKSRIYEVAFARAGIDLILPSSTVQTEVVHQAIYDPIWGIKAVCRPVSRQAKRMLGSAIMHLKERNADAVLLACTELPLAVDVHVLCGLEAIDPTLLFIRAPPPLPLY